MLDLRAWAQMKYEATLRARAGYDGDGNPVRQGDEDARLELFAYWKRRQERVALQQGDE